ncbi:hypothetical protein [Paraburkholderia bannensis]|uniref:hypothetical protein n=1 Tax=Paraburkholderia bannensis TaxID=765414 RepID=UPI002ABE8C9B|nr:hypothetical protein [Paraburkholderia bannensis]
MIRHAAARQFDTINKAGLSPNFSRKDTELIGNGLAALAIAFMFPAFIGSASASPRPQALQGDIETGAATTGLHEIEVEEIDIERTHFNT